MPPTDTLSELFEGLSHPYRRVVLYYLREHERASVWTLADCVTGWVESGPGGGRRGVGHESVRLQLTHVHLPKLADSGFVSYDANAETVDLGTLPSEADDLLSLALPADASGADPDELLATGGTDGE